MHSVNVFFVLLSLVVLSHGTTPSGVKYDGAKIIRITRNPCVDHLVQQQDLDVLCTNSTSIDVLVLRGKLNSVLTTLEENGEKFSIRNENVSESLKRSSSPPHTNLRSLKVWKFFPPYYFQFPNYEVKPWKGATTASTDNVTNWNHYQRLSEIYAYMERLARDYPEIVSVGEMGKSVEGRPLKYLRVSSPGNKNATAVFVEGGMHAREWISPSSVTYIMKELVENRGNLPIALQQLEFYLLPVANPDGYEYTHTVDRLWRKNRARHSRKQDCVGVDLNRNFEFHWGGKGVSSDECSEIYNGPSAASEPETRALQEFLTGLKSNLKAYVTFHNYGEIILIPFAYEKNSFPDDFYEMKTVADNAAAAMKRIQGSVYNTGNTASVLYPASGGSDDWVKGHLGVKYSYCIELKDRGEYGFLLPPSAIINSGREAWEAVKVIASAAASAA